LTTLEIETFISDVSTTRTNIAIASRNASRLLPLAPSDVDVVTALADIGDVLPVRLRDAATRSGRVRPPGPDSTAIGMSLDGQI
jgi:hypothetical protein